MEDEKLTAATDHAAAKRSNPCEMTWGNCGAAGSDLSPLYWGKPSETPHVCSGPRRHLYKLHVCQECGMLGARIQPSPYSKAGAQLRAAILKHGVRAAAISNGSLLKEFEITS